MLESVGRAVGHQVRIKRDHDPRFVALYTVSEANPQGDLSDPSRANVVRTGQAGRERLGTPDEMKAVVQATVVDTAPLPDGVRFFEVAIDDRMQAYFIAIAPHGGAIEPHTDDEAEQLRRELVSNTYPAQPCGRVEDTVTSSRERLTAGTSHPRIYIQRASHCYNPLPLGRSAMVSLSTAFRNGPVTPIFTSAEEHRKTSRGNQERPRSRKFTCAYQDCHERRQSEIPGGKSGKPYQPACGTGHSHRAIRRSQKI